MSTGNPRERLGLPRVAQIGYVVRDLDAAIALYDPLLHWSADTKFAYLERPDDPTLIELLQMPGAAPGSMATRWASLELLTGNALRVAAEPGSQRPLRRRTASASATCFAAWSCELKTWRTMPSRSIT